MVKDTVNLVTTDSYYAERQPFLPASGHDNSAPPPRAGGKYKRLLNRLFSLFQEMPEPITPEKRQANDNAISRLKLTAEAARNMEAEGQQFFDK